MSSGKRDEFIWHSSAPAYSQSYLRNPVLNALSRSCSSGAAVLDIGCGNGAMSAIVAAAGYNVVGIDPSRSGIAEAKNSFPQIEFITGDVSVELPRAMHGAFDAVISTEVIEHLLLPRQLMERAREALKPGGTLVVSTPFHGYLKNLALALTNKFDFHWHPLTDYGHVKFFSRRTLHELFEEYGFQEGHFAAVGRIPLLAKSMVMTGVKAK